MTIRPKTRQRVLILLTAIALLLTADVGLYVYRQHHNEIEAQERRDTGLAAFEQGDYDAAIEDLARYAKHDAQDVEVLRALARSHDRARPQTPEHRAAAIRFYRQAYRIDPPHELAFCTPPPEKMRQRGTCKRMWSRPTPLCCANCSKSIAGSTSVSAIRSCRH
ncbi:MAG: hypothetical protein ACOC3G_00755 [Phycisphaeraceae bacterium]